MSKDYDYLLEPYCRGSNWLDFSLQGKFNPPNCVFRKNGKEYNAYTPELSNVLLFEFEAFNSNSKETVMVSNENRTFILNDFCKWYDEGKRVFIENHQPAFIGMINNNAEVLALTLEDYLTNYKSSNFHSEVPMLNEYNVGLDVYVKKQIDLIITPHNIKSRGFYAGFYTALMDFSIRNRILLQTVIKRLNDAEATTEPETITADWKPKQMELAHAIVMKYAPKGTFKHGLKAKLARYYFEFVRTSTESDYRGFYNLLTPKNHSKNGKCKVIGKEICQIANREKAAKWLLQHLYNE
jgi:hypothetical protein